MVVPASRVSARSPEATSASCPLLIWVIKSPHLEFLVLLGQEALTFYYAPSPTNYAGIPNATPSGPQTPTVPPPPCSSFFCRLLPITVVTCSIPFHLQTSKGSLHPASYFSASVLPTQTQFSKAVSSLSPLPPCTPTPQPSLCRTCMHFCHETAFTDTSLQVQARFSMSLSAAQARPPSFLDLCGSPVACWLLPRHLALGFLLCPS